MIITKCVCFLKTTVNMLNIHFLRFLRPWPSFLLFVSDCLISFIISIIFPSWDFVLFSVSASSNRPRKVDRVSPFLISALYRRSKRATQYLHEIILELRLRQKFKSNWQVGFYFRNKNFTTSAQLMKYNFFSTQWIAVNLHMRNDITRWERS